MNKSNRERSIKLLFKAQATFRCCEDPFNPSWLSENNVTIDECYSLSNSIATAIGLYLQNLNRVSSKDELTKTVGMEHLANALVEEIIEDEKRKEEKDEKP